MRNEKLDSEDQKSITKTSKKETKNKWLIKKSEVAVKKEEEGVHLKLNLEKFKQKPEEVKIKKKQEVKTPEKKTGNGILNLSQFQKKTPVNIMQSQRNQMFYK